MKQIPRRIILGPGPSSAHPRVLRAMSSPVMGYLDPDFFEILEEVSEMLSAIFNTKDTSFAIAGTGSAGMEAGLNCLVDNDEEVLILNNPTEDDISDIKKTNLSSIFDKTLILSNEFSEDEI